MVSNPRKFAKKNVVRNKNRNRKGGYSSEYTNGESVNNPQKEEVKNDGKLVGDSGYDCKDCHGKNHLTKGCILKRLNEKKDEGEEKYEAYNLIIFGS